MKLRKLFGDMFIADEYAGYSTYKETYQHTSSDGMDDVIKDTLGMTL